MGIISQRRLLSLRVLITPLIRRMSPPIDLVSIDIDSTAMAVITEEMMFVLLPARLLMHEFVTDQYDPLNYINAGLRNNKKEMTMQVFEASRHQ